MPPNVSTFLLKRQPIPNLTLGVADGSEKGGQEGGRRADSATLGRVGDTGRAQAEKEGGYWGGWWAVGGEWQVASGPGFPCKPTLDPTPAQ